MRSLSFVKASLVLALAVAVVVACRPGGRGRTDGDGDGDADVEVPCERLIDTDGDSIADLHEGSTDFDLDGTPNFLDDDSDDDGLLDVDEAGDDDMCTHPPDHDGDGWHDALDRDSDNDGLGDAEEVELYGTDPTNPDSDGDTFTDLVEVAANTDPNDAGVGIPPDDFFVVLPYGGPEVPDNLQFNTDIEVADVFFLVDTTGSMADTINDVATSLSSVIVPGIRESISNAWIGVGRFEDFPVGYYGDMSSHYSATQPGLPEGDVPFFLHSVVRDPMTSMPEIEQAVEYLRQTGSGGDGSESHTEGLYQTATGEGFPGYIDPQHCEMSPDDPYPPRGYPCFRPGALPIVVLITDAAMHNGPSNFDAYGSDVPGNGHTVDQALEELNAIGARVIGVGSQAWGDAISHLNYVASATGTVDPMDQPLVYECDAAVTAEVVDAIAELAGNTPQDVSTTTQDLPDRQEYLDRGEEEIDATGFIRAIRPVRAIPEEGLLHGMDETTFRGVIPGTTVEFEVVFQNDFVPPRETSRIYEALIIVVGNGVAHLDERHVYIIVPPEGEEILI